MFWLAVVDANACCFGAITALWVAFLWTNTSYVYFVRVNHCGHILHDLTGVRGHGAVHGSAATPHLPDGRSRLSLS